MPADTSCLHSPSSLSQPIILGFSSTTTEILIQQSAAAPRNATVLEREGRPMLVEIIYQRSAEVLDAFLGNLAFLTNCVFVAASERR